MANELGSKFLGQKYPELKTKILKNNTKKIPKTKKKTSKISNYNWLNVGLKLSIRGRKKYKGFTLEKYPKISQ